MDTDDSTTLPCMHVAYISLFACKSMYPSPPLLPQEEMSHALATMRVQEDPTKIKKVSESKNPLLARRAKKKSKSGKWTPQCYFLINECN